MDCPDEIIEARETEGKVKPLFPNRWSPRAMSGEEISDRQLNILFEAARWGPSSYNNQYWRFLYARRGSDEWRNYLDLLVEQNREWAQDAGVLMVIVSKTTFDFNEKPARTHSFDTGAAWENLALQGSILGLVVHTMQGFNYDRAREVLEIPEAYHVEAMVAVGKHGSKDDLPPDLREQEKPSDRKSLDEIVTEGRFDF